MKRIFQLTCLAALIWLCQGTVTAGPLTVNTTADTHSQGYSGNESSPGSTASTDSGGHTSLRSAIEYASTKAGSWTINLPSGTYNLNLGNLIVGVQAGTTITITNGQGTAANTTIHQNQTHRMVFLVNINVDANVVFNLANVTVSGGNEDDSDPDFFGGGGAILAGGSSSAPGNVVTLNGVVFSGNSTSSAIEAASGGAIIMTGGGNLAVTNCVFSGNHAGSTGILGGGAIYFSAGDDPGNLTVVNSTFTGNSAPSAQAQGGAIYLDGAGSGNADTISQCTFTGNTSAYQGGAIYLASGSLTANLNRITGNTASTASGLYVFPTGTGWANATNNWWGGNTGPTGTGGDTVSPTTSSTPPLANGQIAFNPWIVLTNTASPGTIAGAGSTTMTASFLQNSRNQPLSALQVAALVGLPVTWSGAVHGSFTNAQVPIGAGGQATNAFINDGTCNNGSGNATVDHATSTASVSVQCADLRVSQANNVGGTAVLGNSWTWTLRVTNAAAGAAVFTNGSIILVDNLPSTNLTCVVSSVTNSSGLIGVPLSVVDGSGNLTCTANGPVQLAAAGFFDVPVTATPTLSGTFTNPRAGGSCTANPSDSVPETNFVNNTATANSVVVTCPGITASPSGGTAICAGHSASFTVTISGGQAPYSVTLNNGGGTQVGSSPLAFTVSPAATTTYAVSSGTDSEGCPISDSGSVTITVNPLPSAAILAPSLACANATGNQASGPSGLAYAWTINNGTITGGATAQTVTFTAGASGLTTLFLTTTNGSGCTAQNSANVLIDVPPMAGVDRISAVENTAVSVPAVRLLINDSSPSGGPLSLTSVNSPSAQGGTVALGGGLVTYTPAPNFLGPDSFTYTVSDSHCTTQGTVAVNVINTPEPATNNLVLTATAPHAMLLFAGAPGQVYVVQWAPAVAGPWTDFADGTITADWTGLVQYTDATQPPPAVRFYRTRVGP